MAAGVVVIKDRLSYQCSDIRDAVIRARNKCLALSERFGLLLQQHGEHVDNVVKRSFCDICLCDNKLIIRYYPRVHIYVCLHCIYRQYTGRIYSLLDVEYIQSEHALLCAEMSMLRQFIRDCAAYMYSCGLVTSAVTAYDEQCSMCYKQRDNLLAEQWSTYDPRSDAVRHEYHNTCVDCKSTISSRVNNMRAHILLSMYVVPYDIVPDIAVTIHAYMKSLICADAASIAEKMSSV